MYRQILALACTYFYRLHHNHVSLVSVAALSFLCGGFDGFARINFALSTHVTMSSDFREIRKKAATIVVNVHVCVSRRMSENTTHTYVMTLKAKLCMSYLFHEL